MRYYKIVITNPQTGKVFQPAGMPIDPSVSFTSYMQVGSRGQTIPGAQNVILDIPIIDAATPAGAGSVQVWGVSLKDIAQANNLNKFKIDVFGGFQPGLPLASSAARYSGQLISGMIFQAFGNWIGNDMTLDLVIQPNTGALDDPKNISFKWLKGTTLASNISDALGTVFGSDYKINIQISPNLILTEDTPFTYTTLTQFARWVRDTSQGILNTPNYLGVQIALKGKTFNVYDGTTTGDPIQIRFSDLIGQPTWQSPLTIQATMVMRSDLAIGSYILFPPGQVTTTSAGAVPLGQGISQKSAFQGSFLVNSVRHVGNFRQPDGNSWVTVVDCVALLNAPSPIISA